jgi:glycosyltransferase involved in cell wall biosynthesis
MQSDSLKSSNTPLAASPRLKVLLSAYACEPGSGSEPGVGWNIARGLASIHDVWVLTRENNRKKIENALSTKPIPNLHFIYHDLPTWMRFWKRGRRGVRLYYFLWQFTALKILRPIVRQQRFDVGHHVTFVTYWFPTCLAFLPLPFVWGPVGGGEDAPVQFWLGFGAKGIFLEVMRCGARAILQLTPCVRSAARRCGIAVATAERTLTRLERMNRRVVELTSEVALAADDPEYVQLKSLALPKTDTIRFLSVGNLIYWKGFHLGLYAFARANIENSQYWIVGDGQEHRRLIRLAKRLMIADRVRFLGRRPRREVLDLLSECHVLIHPSLHDSGGWSCIEAMAAGRPILCLDLGGPATQITDQTGFKCSPASPMIAIDQLASAMRKLSANPALLEKMGKAARLRVETSFLLDNRISQYSAYYRRILSEQR